MRRLKRYLTVAAVVILTGCRPRIDVPTLAPTLALLPTQSPPPASTLSLTPTSAASQPVPTTLPSQSPTAASTSLPTPTLTLQPPPPGPPNIVLIIVDTLRADHVSAYGYSRSTTPNLDTLLADQGVLFSDVTSPSPWTCPANAALMTGYMPSEVGATWKTLRQSLPSKFETLAEYLHGAGYYTAGFASTYCVKGQLGFAQGFDHYDDSLTDRPTSNKARADEINALAISWLQTHWTPELSSRQPLFLYLYYFDPHAWYTPPPPYDTLYDSSYTGSLTPDIYQDGQATTAGEIAPTARDIEHLLALYDGEISYWDFHLGLMMTYLQDAHLLDNALIILTSDHGEFFGEHNLWTHGNGLYEEVIRVPLLMRYTGVLQSRQRIDVPVQSMDLMPTILDFAGVSAPEGLQAVSLRRLLQSGSLSVPREVYSELDGITNPFDQFYWLAPRVDLRSVKREEWKLIHHVGQMEADELYQVQPVSPYEMDNQATTQPEQADLLRQSAQAWFAINR